MPLNTQSTYGNIGKLYVALLFSHVAGRGTGVDPFVFNSVHILLVVCRLDDSARLVSIGCADLGEH